MSPNKPKTPHRTIRVPDELWVAAQDAADSQGVTLTAVLTAALEKYVKDARRKSPGVASNQDSEGV